MADQGGDGLTSTPGGHGSGAQLAAAKLVQTFGIDTSWSSREPCSGNGVQGFGGLGLGGLGVQGLGFGVQGLGFS